MQRQRPQGQPRGYTTAAAATAAGSRAVYGTAGTGGAGANQGRARRAVPCSDSAPAAAAPLVLDAATLPLLLLSLVLFPHRVGYALSYRWRRTWGQLWGSCGSYCDYVAMTCACAAPPRPPPLLPLLQGALQLSRIITHSDTHQHQLEGAGEGKASRLRGRRQKKTNCLASSRAAGTRNVLTRPPARPPAAIYFPSQWMHAVLNRRLDRLRLHFPVSCGCWHESEPILDRLRLHVFVSA